MDFFAVNFVFTCLNGADFIFISNRSILYLYSNAV